MQRIFLVVSVVGLLALVTPNQSAVSAPNKAPATMKTAHWVGPSGYDGTYRHDAVYEQEGEVATFGLRRFIGYTSTGETGSNGFPFAWNFKVLFSDIKNLHTSTNKYVDTGPREDNTSTPSGTFSSASSAGTDHYFTGLRACTRKVSPAKKKVIYQARLFVSRLEENGDLKPAKTNLNVCKGCGENGPANLLSSDCEVWEKKLTCRKNEVIVGIRAHRTHNGDTNFSGLSILCMPIKQPAVNKVLPGGTRRP